MPKLTTTTRNNVINLFTFQSCDIYSGAIPATGDTEPTGVLLATFDISAVFSAASNGLKTASVPITSSPALATGTAGYARLWNLEPIASDKNMYCTVGVASGEVQLSSLSFVIDETQDITQLSLQWPTS